MNQTPVNWVAYKVIKINYCEPDEVIGYFQTRSAAEAERLSYIEKNKLPEKGICCHQSKSVEIEEILIKA